MCVENIVRNAVSFYLEQENVIPKVNKKETKKVDHKIKKEPKKIKISPASNNRNVSMTDAGVSENSPDKMVHEKPAKKRARKSVASEPIHDNVNNVDKIDKLNWPSAEADGICVTRTLSNASSGSIGSIEKRLAEMTSPVKSATVPNDEIQMIGNFANIFHRFPLYLNVNFLLSRRKPGHNVVSRT